MSNEKIYNLYKQMDADGDYDLHLATEPVAIADSPLQPDGTDRIQQHVFKCELKVILAGDKPVVVFYAIGWGQDIDFHLARNVSREDALSQALARFGGA